MGKINISEKSILVLNKDLEFIKLIYSIESRYNFGVTI